MCTPRRGISPGAGGDERDHRLLVVPGAVLADVLDEIVAVHHHVEPPDLLHLLGGAVHQHGDQAPVVVQEPALERLLRANEHAREQAPFSGIN
eukprot:839072-Prorocentrum_minimum.AAC.2